MLRYDFISKLYSFKIILSCNFMYPEVAFTWSEIPSADWFYCPYLRPLVKALGLKTVILRAIPRGKPVGGGFMFQGEMMQPGWGDDAGGAATCMDDTDMGNWEGSQESNSSWSSARDWNRAPRKKPIYHVSTPCFLPCLWRRRIKKILFHWNLHKT